MSIPSLHLFGKNTDAPHVMAGFEYQKLRTLETWLSNWIEKRDEEIICEYEEDIFQRNSSADIIRFRQIKLYSSSLSFSAEEVNKALIHFFYLYNKPDYANTGCEFIFESNTSISRKRGTNDAELLQAWVAAQGHLNGPLLVECRQKMERILRPYLGRELAALSADECNATVEHLLEETRLNTFVNSIRWVFNAVPPVKAIERVKDNITSLLNRLSPIPGLESNGLAHGHLLKVISDVTVKPDPADRKLTSGMLDEALLSLGTEVEFWYMGVYHRWRKRDRKVPILTAQIFEIIEAARYCRISGLFGHHAKLWQDLFFQLVSSEDTPVSLRRRIIFESHILLVRAHHPGGYFHPEMYQKIVYYFEHLGESDSIYDLRNDIEFCDLLILSGQKAGIQLLEKTPIEIWLPEIQQRMNRVLEEDISLLDKCICYEVLGHASFVLSGLVSIDEGLQRAVAYYRRLIGLLPCEGYNIVDLYQFLARRHQSLIQSTFPYTHSAEEELAGVIESVLSLVGSVEQNWQQVRNYLERGLSYLQSKRDSPFPVFLDYLHKCKKLLDNAELETRLITHLSIIAQSYSALKMYYAAGYYALAAFAMIRVKDPNAESQAVRLIGLIIEARFYSGCWMTLIAEMPVTLGALWRFGADFGSDQHTIKADESHYMLAAVFWYLNKYKPLEWPGMKSEIDLLGRWYEHLIKPLMDNIDAEAEDGEITGTLTDIPFSDIGEVRTVRWKTESHSWSISFQNDRLRAGLGEEFCAMLQIFLTEVSHPRYDFLLYPCEINIRLTTEDDRSDFNIDRLDTEHIHSFTIHIPFHKEDEDARAHSVHIGILFWNILKQISLLPLDVFDNQMESFVVQNQLFSRIFILEPYCRLRELLLKEERSSLFTAARHAGTYESTGTERAKAVLPIYYGKELDTYPLGITTFVDDANASFSQMWQISSKSWLSDPKLFVLIDGLRDQGWMDWQIVMAIHCYALQYKIGNLMPSPPRSREERSELFREIHDKIAGRPEEDFYLPVPTAIFFEEKFLGDMRFLPFILFKVMNFHMRLSSEEFVRMKEFLFSRVNKGMIDSTVPNPLRAGASRE